MSILAPILPFRLIIHSFNLFQSAAELLDLLHQLDIVEDQRANYLVVLFVQLERRGRALVPFWSGSALSLVSHLTIMIRISQTRLILIGQVCLLPKFVAVVSIQELLVPVE